MGFPAHWSFAKRAAFTAALLVFVIGINVSVRWLREEDRQKEERARQAITAVLATSPEIRVDGEPVDDPGLVLDGLRTLTHVEAHHSSVRRAIHVALTSGGGERMEVVIARDTYTRGEFWVFRPGPNSRRDPLGEYAGRLESPALEEYLDRKGILDGQPR